MKKSHKDNIRCKVCATPLSKIAVGEGMVDRCPYHYSIHMNNILEKAKSKSTSKPENKPMSNTLKITHFRYSPIVKNLYLVGNNEKIYTNDFTNRDNLVCDFPQDVKLDPVYIKIKGQSVQLMAFPVGWLENKYYPPSTVTHIKNMIHAVEKPVVEVTITPKTEVLETNEGYSG